MPTIRDVAHEAGVSIATVSRVFQGGDNVLPETKERVLNAARLLDYHPNRLAQQFRMQESRNIVVIIPELGNPFYTEIFAGIENVAQAHHYSVFIKDSHGDPEAEAHIYDQIGQKQLDGVITFSTSVPREEMHRYAGQYPIVVACRYFGAGSLPNVTIDNIKAIKDMVNYMIGLGHRQICYLAGPSDILLYRDRTSGYLAALADRGLPVDESLIVNCEASIQGGYDAINALMSKKPLPFSAVVASGDTMAIGAIRALASHGISVPGDVAVSGFDDIELSALFSPSLTTVRQPKYQIGVRCMEKLLDLIDGKTPAMLREVFPYELVIRESSGNFVVK